MSRIIKESETPPGSSASQEKGYNAPRNEIGAPWPEFAATPSEWVARFSGGEFSPTRWAGISAVAEQVTAVGAFHERHDLILACQNSGVSRPGYHKPQSGNSLHRADACCSLSAEGTSSLFRICLLKVRVERQERKLKTIVNGQCLTRSNTSYSSRPYQVMPSLAACDFRFSKLRLTYSSNSLAFPPMLYQTCSQVSNSRAKRWRASRGMPTDWPHGAQRSIGRESASALMLGGLCSGVAFLAAVVAAKVARSVQRRPDVLRPFGYVRLSGAREHGPQSLLSTSERSQAVDRPGSHPRSMTIRAASAKSFSA